MKTYTYTLRIQHRPIGLPTITDADRAVAVAVDVAQTFHSPVEIDEEMAVCGVTKYCLPYARITAAGAIEWRAGAEQ